MIALGITYAMAYKFNLVGEREKICGNKPNQSSKMQLSSKHFFLSQLLIQNSNRNVSMHFYLNKTFGNNIPRGNQIFSSYIIHLFIAVFP